MAGDVEAFEPFVNLFHKKLFHFTFLTCGHREDAEEVAQETLLKMFTSFSQLRDAGHVRSWNLDQEGYEAAVRAFVERLNGGRD